MSVLQFPDEAFIVEDNLVMQTLANEILSTIGLPNITIAGHLESFKRILAVFLQSKHRTLLILLDSSFPENETVIEGSEVMWKKAISHIRELIEGLFEKQIAVICYTAQGTKQIGIVEKEIQNLNMPNFFVLPSQGKNTSREELKDLISSLRQRSGFYK